MNILIVTAGHIYWALIMWKTLCRALYSYHAYNSSQLLLSSFYKRGNWGSEWFTKNKQWKQTGTAEPQIQISSCSYLMAHLLFVHATFAIRIFKPEWILSQLTRLSHISHPSQAKSRGKLRRETWGAAGISPVLHDPKDLNVKQMGPRHSSKTHTVLFGSFDTSFGYICLFSLKYICAHKLESKVHWQKSFLEMFCFLPRKDGKQKNSAILLTARRKVIRKLRALCVFAC